MTNHTERYESITAATIAERVPALIEALGDCRDPELLDALGRAEARLLLTLPLSKKGKPFSANTLKQKHLKPYYEAFRTVHNEVPLNASKNTRGSLSPHFCHAITDELHKVVDAGKTETPKPKTKATKKESPKIKPRAVLQLASKLIKSAEWQEIAVGLAIALGRRTTEITYTGELDSAAKPGFIRFRGVLKLKKERWETERNQWREIPCLLPAAEVIEAWDRLRANATVQVFHSKIAKVAETISDPYKAYLAATDKAQSLCNKPCNLALQEIPLVATVVTLRRDKKAPSMHDLRAIYGAMSVKRESSDSASLNEQRDLYHQFVSESDANYGDYGINGKVPQPKDAGKHTATIRCTTLAAMRMQALESKIGTTCYHDTLDHLLDMADKVLGETEVKEPETVEVTAKVPTKVTAEDTEMNQATEARFNALESKFDTLVTLLQNQAAEVHTEVSEVPAEVTPAEVPTEAPKPEISYMDKQAEASKQWQDTPSAVLFGWNGSGRALRHAGAAYERTRRVVDAVIEFNELQESPAARIALNGGLIRGVTNASSKFAAQWLSHHAPMLSDLHSQWMITNVEYHNRDVFGGDPVAIITAAISNTVK